MSGDPNAPTPAASDNDTSVATTAFVQGELGDYLPLAGGTMSGDITLGASVDINFNDTTSGLAWSDVRIDRTAANIIALGAGDKLQQSAAPAVDDDLTNKLYVDNLIDGLTYKEPVDLATTSGGGDLDLTGEETIDGTLTSASRVLVKDQTLPAENGIYTTGAGAWVRTDDADTAAEVDDGSTVWVKAGTANGDTRFTQTNTIVTIGTTSQTWVQTGASSVVAELSDLSDADTTGLVDGSIFRYELSSTEWQPTTATTLLLSDAGQVLVPTTGTAAGILIGGDAQIYRSGADILATPDSFLVEANGGKTTLNLSDTTADVGITIGGDVTLYRSAADVLSTDDSLAVGVNLAVTGTSTLSAGVTFAVTTKTADYSVDLATDYIILADNSGDSADLIITLPAAHNSGDTVHIKDSGGNAASGTNQIFISPDAGDSIDAGAVGVDFELTVDWQSATVTSDGTNWYII